MHGGGGGNGHGHGREYVSGVVERTECSIRVFVYTACTVFVYTAAAHSLHALAGTALARAGEVWGALVCSARERATTAVPPDGGAAIFVYITRASLQPERGTAVPPRPSEHLGPQSRQPTEPSWAPHGLRSGPWRLRLSRPVNTHLEAVKRQCRIQERQLKGSGRVRKGSQRQWKAEERQCRTGLDDHTIRANNDVTAAEADLCECTADVQQMGSCSTQMPTSSKYIIYGRGGRHALRRPVRVAPYWCRPAGRTASRQEDSHNAEATMQKAPAQHNMRDSSSRRRGSMRQAQK